MKPKDWIQLQRAVKRCQACDLYKLATQTVFGEELSIPRREIYVTNAVKHFKWERSGKTRLHKKPSASEIEACHSWLCLGATAAKSVVGRDVSIGRSRGHNFSITSGPAVVRLTWHPSTALRAPSHEARAQKRAELKADLQAAWRLARPRSRR